MGGGGGGGGWRGGNGFFLGGGIDRDGMVYLFLHLGLERQPLVLIPLHGLLQTLRGVQDAVLIDHAEELQLLQCGIP